MKAEIRNLNSIRSVLPWLWLPIVAAVYFPSLHGEFLNWDDLDWILTNPVVNGEAPLAEAWTGFVLHTYYPLYATALRLLWSLGGDPLPFHLASVLGFGLAAVLWHLCLARLGIGGLWRWFGTALFALHPLRVETVAWASALRDVLSLDLALLALWLHLGTSRLRWTASAAFAASLLCKTTLFALAPLPLLVDVLWRRRPWRPALVAAAPWVLLGVAGAGVTWWAYQPVADLNVRPGGDLPGSLPVLAAIQLRYLGLQSWPADLAALPSAPAPGLTGWLALALFAALLAGAALALVRGRRGPMLLLCAYALPMVPVCGLLPLSFAVADRYTLLPSLALSAGAAWWSHRLAGGEGRGLPVATATAAMAVPLVMITHLQIPVWGDSTILWRHSLALHPREVAAHQNYAAAVGAAGDMDTAARHLVVALELAGGREPQTQRLVQLLLFAELLRLNVPAEHVDPILADYARCDDDAACLADLAVALAGARLAAPSEVIARRATDLDGPVEVIWLARATYEYRDGRPWRALGHAGRGLRDQPDDPQLLTLRALALLRLGGREAARPAAEDLPRPSQMSVDEVLDQLERVGGS